jgi:hypothetical protein
LTLIFTDPGCVIVLSISAVLVRMRVSRGGAGAGVGASSPLSFAVCGDSADMAEMVLAGLPVVMRV